MGESSKRRVEQGADSIVKSAVTWIRVLGIAIAFAPAMTTKDLMELDTTTLSLVSGGNDYSASYGPELRARVTKCHDAIDQQRFAKTAHGWVMEKLAVDPLGPALHVLRGAEQSVAATTKAVKELCH